MEQCIWCFTVYDLEESDAEHKASACSKGCEDKYIEWNNEPLEFI